MTYEVKSSELINELLDEEFGTEDQEDRDNICEQTTATVDEMLRDWNEWVRDLSHLSRSEKAAVLAHETKCAPIVVDGLEVHIFSEVQTVKGQPRKRVAIIDHGSFRMIYAM